MKTVKKIQPKIDNDIDFDALAQKIRGEQEVELLPKNPKVPKSPIEKAKSVGKSPKTVLPVRELKKAGRKKTNTEEIHRFAIDLPLWLFEKIRKDADDNFSTVRGQILKLLLNTYKNV